jgi:hypothetical protein
VISMLEISRLTGRLCFFVHSAQTREDALRSRSVRDPFLKRPSAALFNTLVENTVEKAGSIFVSSSARDVSTPCTKLVAGTLV